MHRSFSREFKLEAVRRANARPAGVTLTHIANELGIGLTLLRGWIKQVEVRAGAPPTDVFPGQGRLPADEEDVRQLRRENARLQQENEFLKKAAAYFAREPQ
jgi:transposase